MLYRKILISLPIIAIILFNFSLVSAVSVDTQGEAGNLLKNVGLVSGYNTTPKGTYLSETVGKYINASLSLLGVIFLVLTVYAGYLWLTAGGDEKKVEDAQKYLKNGVIGLLIVLAAFGVTKLIMTYLLQASLST